eukprot:TRINITY_DN824_c0_g1_i4.p3 TRINITY_DN824_c0_g1~~TRINITY_DN824_c0_g1_i4.p3  ORF type:complete len:116 (+),score=9.32 TRINITY_DN824_c0_g1_i4:246-593(+)
MRKSMGWDPTQMRMGKDVAMGHLALRLQPEKDEAYKQDSARLRMGRGATLRRQFLSAEKDETWEPSLKWRKNREDERILNPKMARLDIVTQTGDASCKTKHNAEKTDSEFHEWRL